MKKLLQILIILLLAITIIPSILFYKPDIPKEEIIAKYELPNSAYINLMGMNVHYTIEGDGEPLLLLHGTSSSIHTWNDWTDKLKDKYKVIRVDLPGFGLTGEQPDRKYDTDSYVDFLVEFMNKVNINKTHIAGNSFGGYLAWNLALLHPNKVNKLILLNASGYPRPENKPLPIGFKLAKSKFLSPPMQYITPEFIVNKTTLKAYENDSQITSETKQRYYDLLLMEGNRVGLIGKSQQIKYKYTSRIPEIKHETLILWGDKDEVVPVEAAYMFNDDLINSKLIIYENIGHLPMEETPVKSVNDLLEFLEYSTEEKVINKEINLLFEEAGISGSVLIYDYQNEIYFSNNYAHAKMKKLPASTFKIPNTIIGLELGIIDESSIFTWDGEERFMKKWEQDLTLKKAFQFSCVPCYQELARKIGVTKMQQSLETINYPEMHFDETTIDNFWLTGKSSINSFEQIRFLKAMFNGKLNINDNTLNIIKNIMINEVTELYLLSGKTGLSVNNSYKNGWFVGYLKNSEGLFFFATNLESDSKISISNLGKLRKSLTLDAFKILQII